MTALPKDEAGARRRRARDDGDVSAVEADWSRERRPALRWSPSHALLRALRDHERLRSSSRLDHVWQRRLAAWRHRFWSIVCGAEIPLGTDVGGGLLLPHPNGVVVHPAVRIGPNCLIFQQVTLGAGGKVPGTPTLEGHVDVGAGAKILGGVRIGAHATIGANAVVLCDVPAGATAVGIPARVLPLDAR